MLEGEEFIFNYNEIDKMQKNNFFERYRKL